MIAFAGTELLGEVVCWSMGSTEVGFDRLVEALKESGLNEKDAPELNRKSAFSRAAKHLKNERVIDKVSATSEIIEFQLTAKRVTEGSVEYEEECKLLLDLNCDDIDTCITCAKRPELATEATMHIKQALATRTTSDVTRIVQRLFKNNADLFALDPQKGVAYFVPESHREFTEKVDDFLKRLGGKLCRMPVPKGTEEGNRSVKDAVDTGLSDMLVEISDTMAHWDLSDITKRSFNHAEKRLDTLMFKAESYAQYLGDSQQKLLDDIAKQKQELNEKKAQALEQAAKDSE